MNDVARASRQCEAIIARYFDGRCPKRVARNQRRAERMLRLLRAPNFDEGGRLAVVESANVMLGFNCSHKPVRAEQARRNAQAILDALRDVIPVRFGPDVVDEFHGDMLKSGATADYISARASLARPNPGYSKWMTLAALDMSDRDFDDMLAYHTDQGYGSILFYINSGRNMSLFSRAEFNFYNDHNRIIDRCDRIWQAGMRPVPCMMPNHGADAWQRVEYPRIRALLAELSRRDLIHSYLLGLEIDKVLNNGNRSASDVQSGRNWFGIRQVLDILGGDKPTSGLLSIHHPELFVWGHSTHVWLRDEGLDEIANYAGPTMAGLGDGQSGKYRWFQGFLHQPSGLWGRPGTLDDKIEIYEASYRAAIPRMKADGVKIVPFEYAQEPRFTEAQAWQVADALRAISKQHGISDSFGTGALRRAA